MTLNLPRCAMSLSNAPPAISLLEMSSLKQESYRKRDARRRATDGDYRSRPAYMPQRTSSHAAADATRLQEELDTALKERADALALVTEAATEVAAKHEM